jgi:hypothetical protein
MSIAKQRLCPAETRAENASLNARDPLLGKVVRDFKPRRPEIRFSIPVAYSLLLGLDDLPSFQTAAADANPPCTAPNLCLHRVQIHIPPPPGDVVRVRNVIPKLRTLAANTANLCHVFSNKTSPLP